MDTQPYCPDGVSDLEHRLAACAAAPDGLDADAMLFAAGRASARSGRVRFVWPALTAFLAALTVVLSVRLATERAARLELARRLDQPASAPLASVPLTPLPVSSEPSLANEPKPSSLFAAHRALEHGLDAWPPTIVPPVLPGPLPPEPPTLRVGRLSTLPDL